ncbi:MAG TPA: hypothetical protein DCS07_16580 [Bdellovibrionales bacterium]|nr:MAG: hypothetical protein A2X97_12030 [Bdellovibrionales bacterium GWA1_52_35]OFZ32924.1 MAG: hypothetical protein A2070_03515 [Bdellovibrionales bacterium GWC1_52_8]HAR44222.1 hypothetical protein [Bdellovibrionales bacterium]HCM39038.1 hypothetical protein [Bdellovibrionales bacterium]
MRITRWVWGSFFVLSLTQVAGAGEPWDYSGSIRAGGLTQERCFSGPRNEGTLGFWAGLGARLSESTRVRLDGRAISSRHNSCDPPAFDLREAFFTVETGALEFRAGRQLIRWGRVDAFNPTDQVGPHDYTLPVFDEQDQRLGIFAASIGATLAEFSVKALWLPEFRPNYFPFPSLPPGVSLREARPDEAWNQWSVRVERMGSGFDASASFFDGFDRNPDLGFHTSSLAGAEFALRHHRIRMLGADGAWVLGQFGARAEVAYVFTADRDGMDPMIKNSYFQSVLGLDRTFWESCNVNLQHMFRSVTRFTEYAGPDPVLRQIAGEVALLAAQTRPSQHGISLRIADRWFDDTLEAELGTAVWLADVDTVTRARAAYSLTERVTGIVGAEIYRGKSRGTFGRLRALSTFYGELRFLF